ncbi:MAG: ATP phosphoribosyltransferase regulatory subunit [Oscillospiraceae bacterium]|nr:ATP phosphoribosyltransferase regulatory subunit [Oscillospiraceae bacterium]
MKRHDKITPEGMRDYLFDDVQAYDSVRDALANVFELHGYRPVATPLLEFHDVFRRHAHGWLADRMYHTTDSRGRLLVLRPDNTLPIARIAATHLLREPLPLRLCYHQSVFRRSQVYGGHADESMQSGVELLGAHGMDADLEILSCAVQALRAAGAQGFRIELGHAEIFSCLADSLRAVESLSCLADSLCAVESLSCLADSLCAAENLEAGETLRDELASAIESKNTPALKALLAPHGENPAAKALLALPTLFGGEEVLQRARELFSAPCAIAALDYLAELFAKLKAQGLGDCIDIDLSLVHGQHYYTGLVFRGFIAGSGATVLAGGRYDNLMAEFGRDAAAVGFAIEVDALVNA